MNAGETLERGDVVRVRPAYTYEEWCLCQVQILSGNQESVVLRVVHGALRIKGGGILVDSLLMRIDREQGKAFELISDTELEVEKRTP